MLPRFVLTATMVVSAAAATLGAPPAAGRPAVGLLVWTKAVHLEPIPHAVMAWETRSILERLGLAVSWRTGRGRAPSEHEVWVVPIEQKGDRVGSRIVLGRYVRIDGRRGAAVVYYDDVVRIASAASAGDLDSSLRPARSLGRLLGRIVAHEVLHGLRIAHSPTGLMARRLDLSLDADVTVDSTTAAAVRQAVAIEAVAIEAVAVDGETTLGAETDERRTGDH